MHFSNRLWDGFTCSEGMWKSFTEVFSLINSEIKN